MNKVINLIASIMIIILICALIFIYCTYYKSDEVINENVYSSGDKDVSTLDIPSGEYIPNDNLLNGSGLIESIINNSGNSHEFLSGNDGDTKLNNDEINKNTQSNNTKDEDSIVSTDYESGNKFESNSNRSGEDVPDTIIEIPSKENNTGKLVISSDPQTSNQEKQEILTEIDVALKGLLEAVGKVEIVDEDKLNASLDSEVDKP